MKAPNPIGRPTYPAVLVAPQRAEPWPQLVVCLSDGASPATPIAAPAIQFSLLREISAGAQQKTVCNRARGLTRNPVLLSTAPGFVKHGMAVGPTFPLLFPAIATAREELLRHADRA